MPIELWAVIAVAGVGLFGWLCLTIYNSIIKRIELVEKTTTDNAPLQAVDNERWIRQDKTNELVSTLRSEQAVIQNQVQTHSNDIKKLEGKIDKIDGKIDQLLSRPQ
ncbi:hypothetical protein [Moritella viscosa]|uniref:hypothetical protein n=1 Tax=Moritella viscosa TaxID=80854 RepID=UPI0005091A0F|nr:hypothetical protein [Moritella viscosa]CED59821.1 putative uncharacterized membrane associated phage protein [Moritella viscosa]SGY90284.1 LemA family protein [Moritella viscosa]SHO03441.1 LemA family protein [Moritella viscosa]